MSPSDPIKMIRIEGEVRLSGFVGLVWSLVNSSYIHSGSNLALLAAFQ